MAGHKSAAPLRPLARSKRQPRSHSEPGGYALAVVALMALPPALMGIGVSPSVIGIARWSNYVAVASLVLVIALIGLSVVGRIRVTPTDFAAILLATWLAARYFAGGRADLSLTIAASACVYSSMRLLGELRPRLLRAVLFSTAWSYLVLSAFLGTSFTKHTELMLGLRFGGVAANPNLAAVLLAVCIPLSTVVGTARTRTVSLLAFAPLSLWLIVRTGSATGLAAWCLSATLSAYLLAGGRSAGHRRVTLLFTSAIALITIALSWWLVTTTPVGNKISTELASGSWSGRTPLMANGLEVFYSAPLVGAGDVVFQSSYGISASHNTYISLAAGAGLIAVILTLFLFGSAIWATRASRPKAYPDLTASAWLALAVAGLAATANEVQFIALVWGLMGSVSGVLALRRRQKDRQFEAVTAG